MQIQRTGSPLSLSQAQSPQSKAAPTAAKSEPKPAPLSLKGLLRKIADGFEAQDKPIKSPGFKQDNDVPGAFYRKVNSGESTANKTISATVVLPRFQSDPKRTFETSDLAKAGPLDKASVYLGSHAKVDDANKTIKLKGGGYKPLEAEADIGLQWSRRFDSKGLPTFVSPEVQNSGKPPKDEQLYSLGTDNVLRNQKGDEFKGDAKKMVPHFTFTPFARVNQPVLDAQGKPMLGEPGKFKMENKYLPLEPLAKRSYFYAGEKVHMSVDRTPGSSEKNVTFSIQRDGQPAKKYPFTSTLLGKNEAQVSLKRVASIDQFTVQTENGVQKRVGVESTKEKQVEATRASVTGLVWERVDVTDRQGKSKPMTGKDFTLLYGRDGKKQAVDMKSTFHVSGYTSAGGERMDITPTLGRKL